MQLIIFVMRSNSGIILQYCIIYIIVLLYYWDNTVIRLNF